MKSNPWRSWVLAHPFTAIICSAALATTAALMAVCNEMTFWIGLVVMALIIGLMAFSCWKFVPLLLLLATNIRGAEQPPREEAVAWGVGIVVIVGGGVVVYKMVRFCQKHFPRSDTNAPAATNLLAQGADAYGGAWTYAPSGSCYSPSVVDPANARVACFQMDCWLERGSLRVRPFLAANNQTESASEFAADLAAWGLTMNPHGEGQSFSRNGVPCEPGAVPIRFLPDIEHTVVIAGTTQAVLVERSGDLATWETVSVLSIPAGMRVRVQDVGELEQSFYRVSLR